MNSFRCIEFRVDKIRVQFSYNYIQRIFNLQYKIIDITVLFNVLRAYLN